MRINAKTDETAVLRPSVTTMLPEGEWRGLRGHGSINGFC
jgi:hypothetical protein